VRRTFTIAVVCASACVLLSACTAASSSEPESRAQELAISGTAPAPHLGAGQAKTVTYCNHQKAHIMEPYVLGSSPAPAAVYVHGGSWISGNFDTGGFIISTIGPELASEGFVVVSLDYRLGPKARWPDQIEDVKCAIRYLRANAHALNINPDEIGAWGQSAGGHLVALLATAGPSAGWDVGAYPDESSKVQAVVDMAGISDLLSLGDQGDSALVQENFVSLLGPVKAAHIGTALWAASPVHYVGSNDPPFLILHSDNDRIVYPQQSQELSWDLTANKDLSRLVTVAGGGHEFDQPGGKPGPAAISKLIVDFFVGALQFHQPFGTGS
jgi:acetyl esterase/lipase